MRLRDAVLAVRAVEEAAMRHVTIALALLPACILPVTEELPAEARPATEPEQDVAHSVLLAWRDHPDLPPAVTPQKQTCLRKTQQFWIARVGDETYDRYCPSYNGQRTACVTEAPWGHHPVRHRLYAAPLIVYHQQHHHAPIRHEFGHVISNCAPDYPWHDPWHEDERIWDEVIPASREL